MPAPAHHDGSPPPALPPGLHALSQRDAEAAARGCVSKFSPNRWRLIRLAETILAPFVRAMDAGRPRRPAGAPNPFKILVVEYGQLGDVALVLPFLQNLRFHYPDARIVLAGNPRFFPLIESEKLVDELVAVEVPWIVAVSRWKKHNPFSSSWMRMARVTRALRREKFDLALSPRADIRDNWFLWLTRANQRVGYGFYGGKCFLTDVAAPDVEHPHYASRWLHLLEHLGQPILDAQPRLRLSPADHQAAAQFLAQQGIGEHDLVIGLHPGARVATRQWGEENFRAAGERLAAQFSAKILWFEEPHKTSAQGRGFVRVGLPLREFAAVLARCSVVICNDSGPMHVATALGTRVVGIFGPNTPAWFGPVGSQNRVVIREGFWCRPCSDRCIFDQPYCLRTISVDQVVQAAAELLAPGIPQPVRTGA
jgi:heptosyltransferase II